MSHTDGSDVHLRRFVLLRKERRITGRREIHKAASNVTAIISIQRHIILHIPFSANRVNTTNYLPTYPTRWSGVLPAKLRGPQLVKKFRAIYGTRRFIAAFTTAHHLSLS